MAFCKKCGTKLPGDEDICSACNSKAVDNTGLDDMLNEITNTKDITSEFNINDIENNKIISILSYISILVLVPIFAAKESKFARFHANQGLVLLICEAVYGVLYMILSALVLAISWRLYFVITILGFLSFAFVIFSILGLINAVKGEEKELPLIGKIRILK